MTIKVSSICKTLFFHGQVEHSQNVHGQVEYQTHEIQDGCMESGNGQVLSTEDLIAFIDSPLYDFAGVTESETKEMR